MLLRFVREKSGVGHWLILSSIFLMLFLSSLSFSVYADDIDTHCMVCGHDNPQWLEPGAEPVCSSCGTVFDITCHYCGHVNHQWLYSTAVCYCEECGRLGLLVPVSEENTTTAKPETQWTESEDEEQENSLVPFEIVIGSAAVGGAVAAILHTASKRKKQKENKQEPVGYILKISHDRVHVSEGEPARILISVLQVDANGQTSVLQSAPIRIDTAPHSVLRVDPNLGYGTMTATISQQGPATSDTQEWLRVTANVPGAEKTAAVAVDVAENLRMVFL